MNPSIKVIAVDAIGSTIFGGTSKSYRIPGIGLGWTPVNLDFNYIDSVYKVSDEQAFLTARAFARFEGILMGPSSGACAFVALKIAQQLTKNERIVCLISDGGDRYISTLFNDEWMSEQGFITNCDINKIRNMAKQLEPWNIPTLAHDHSKLIQNLNVPDSTLQINKEIQQLYSNHFAKID